MNKMYLAIIAFLLVIALLVGGYAFYKTANQTPPVYTPPAVVPTAPTAPTGTPSTQSATPAPKPTVPLTITSFKDGDVVAIAKVTVKGQTAPNAEVAINELDIKADASGNFQTSLGLTEGDNAIEVTASDDAGNYATWSATVTYTPAQ